MARINKQTRSEKGTSRRIVLQTFGAIAAAASLSRTHAENQQVGSYGAPLAEILVPSGLLTVEQKSEMIKDVTDVIVNALKLPPPQPRALWVVIVETAPGGWGVAGQPVVAAGQRPPEARP